jgi:hypothetical protein
MQVSDMGSLRQKNAASGRAREAQDGSTGPSDGCAFRGERDDLTRPAIAFADDIRFGSERPHA